MPGVTVSLKDKPVGTLSDSLGKYELELDRGGHNIVFSYIGYSTQYFPIVLEEKHRRLDVKMSTEAKDMEIVVVTGSKYEKKLSEEVISTEVLKSSVITQNNASFQEAMNKVPGVNMLDNTISIRGGSGFSDKTSNRVLGLLDDMPIVSPENGSIWWQAMPIEEMEQAEVIKGSASALYGSSAMSGVLNFRTVNPTPEGTDQILLNYGFYGQPSNKTWDWWWHHTYIKHNGDTASRLDRPMFGGAQFLHAKQYGDFGVVLSGAYQHDQGYLEYSDYTLARFGGKLRYTPHKLANLTIGLNVNVFYENLEDFFLMEGNGPLTYVPTQIEVTRTRTVSIDPYLNYYDKKGNRHSLKFRIYNVLFNSTTDDSSLSTKYYVEYSFMRDFKKIDLVITTGVSAFFSNVAGTTFGNLTSPYYNTRTEENAAAYIQAEKKFFHRLTLSGGMRLEYAKLDTSQIYYNFHLINRLAGRDSNHQIQSPVAPIFRFGLNYQVAEATFLRGSIGQGFRYPTMAEKYVFNVQSGAEVFPNPNLKPESGWTTEVGVKQGLKVSNWMAYFDVAGYMEMYRDLIDFDSYVPPNNVNPIGEPLQAVNIEHARILGVELSAIANGKIFGVPLNFLAGYNYDDPVNLSYNPKDPNSTYILKYRIQHSVKADIQANFHGFTFGVSAFYNSFIKNIDNSQLGILQSVIEFRQTHDHGDFVMDLRAGYNYKDKVTFNFICKNILDTEYTLRPGLVEPPRNFTFQVGYKF